MKAKNAPCWPNFVSAMAAYKATPNAANRKALNDAKEQLRKELGCGC